MVDKPGKGSSPEEEHDDGTDDAPSGRSDPAKHRRHKPRIPPKDPRAHETKRFIVADLAPLAVTIRDGGVVKDYAPAILITKLAEKINGLLTELGGGFQPMLYGAVPGSSMVLYFGDPRPDDTQGRLPIQIVGTQAQRVAKLLELEGEDLFDSAVQLGATAAQRYNELTQTVHSEGVTLSWRVADEQERVLSPERAERQHTRLTRPGKLEDRFLTVHGVLYRVIAEPRGDHLGTVGIRLHTWSSRPPGVSKGGKVFPAYTSKGVEDAIKDGLINEPVQARLRLQYAAPGTSIRPGLQDIFLDEIGNGPTEESIFGEPMFENDETED